MILTKGFHDHHKPSTKSSALCPMNSAHILKQFGGHLFFFNGHHKPSAVICFISNELCSHSWKIRWSSAFLMIITNRLQSHLLYVQCSAHILEKFGGHLFLFSTYRPKVFMITINRLQSHLLPRWRGKAMPNARIAAAVLAANRPISP